MTCDYKNIDGVLAWLAELLLSRFSNGLKLASNSDCWIISIAESDKKIYIKRNAELYEFGHEISFSYWNAANENFVGAISNNIPAPSISSEIPEQIKIGLENCEIFYDILGLAYWAMTRVEEVECKEFDSHLRFQAKSSHAYKHGYLDRPIVDEWFDVLSQAMLRLWPELPLIKPEFSIKLSHDVDVPSRYAFASYVGICRLMVGDVYKWHDYKSAILATWMKFKSKKRIHRNDPVNTFNWIMTTSEKYKLKSSFYFICGRTNKARDAAYEPEHPAIRALMRDIHSRGHEIGLHPSYGTYLSSGLLANESVRLKRVCAEEGIFQEAWGGRMHYLRWQTPTTLYGWKAARMDYDSTMGYADMPGFRCGTCYEFTAFDPVERMSLSFKIRPLIAMECTVISKTYMGLGLGQESFDQFMKLKNRCRLVKGAFTMLWHNSELRNDASRKLYERIIAG